MCISHLYFLFNKQMAQDLPQGDLFYFLNELKAFSNYKRKYLLIYVKQYFPQFNPYFKDFFGFC